jgi:hypothetical protein
MLVVAAMCVFPGAYLPYWFGWPGWVALTVIFIGCLLDAFELAPWRRPR